MTKFRHHPSLLALPHPFPPPFFSSHSIYLIYELRMRSHLEGELGGESRDHLECGLNLGRISGLLIALRKTVADKTIGALK